ncbi:uncharacterized protein LY89DRAFT_717573 [Mollisia scopiformis]|uniref:Cyanovirin-N domain-containing protein n=1 Tax=Mollisia scopiformis TaxID=149040 RepID=A0A194XDU0_MOLSC|nr:uncharacterized protein LY89DRAFT_717573 [Mollisia scopiformis]KUJ17917.1 hypothetical protein LY89DRAFT_717573 [Mollisia scopiformis]
MKLIKSIFLLAATVSAAALAVTNSSSIIQKRNFADSCSWNFDGRYLTAHCKTYDKQVVFAEMDLDLYIGNLDGTLRHPGDFGHVPRWAAINIGNFIDNIDGLKVWRIWS